MFRPAPWIGALLVFAVACGEDEDRDGMPPGVGITAGLTAGETEGDDGPVDDDNGDGDALDLGDGADDDGPAPGDDCAEVSEIADVGPQPQDVIFMIDNSSSMVAEAGFVQANMNSFSTQITAANIDIHVVVISAFPDEPAGVCIDAPLGLGQCPGADTNLPAFLHVPNYVGSHSSLQAAVGYHEDYEIVLRPTAGVHLVAVTDDDSDMSAADFTAQFTALAPNFADFTFHGIVADEDPFSACFNNSPCCGVSAAEGKVYRQLIDETGGVFGNLCGQEFQPIFTQLAMEVIGGAHLACEFEIPPPPDGETFDRDRVNIEFDDGEGGTLEIGRIDDPTECAAVADAWYYDDPNDPQAIIVCPQTCDKVQGFPSAKISIKFGCETIPAG